MPQHLLTDSTMPVSFCKAGIGSARAMAEFLGPDVYVVEDVHEELKRLAERLSALKSLLKEWPSNPVRELDLQLKAQVAAALKARRLPGMHQAEDRGEVATVLYAVERRALGELFQIVTDDRYGKQLAHDRGFKLVTTPGLVLRMVREEALPRSDGKRVWQQSMPRQKWKEFDVALTRGQASA
jgi:hypothetical protein